MFLHCVTYKRHFFPYRFTLANWQTQRKCVPDMCDISSREEVASCTGPAETQVQSCKTKVPRARSC